MTIPAEGRSARGAALPALTVLVTTRDEAKNIERCLAAVRPLANQLFVLDSESTDGTVDIAKRYADEVVPLTYDHSRIIPWIFQWALDNLPIRNEWVLILEADQAVSPALADEIRRVADAPEGGPDAYFLRRIQFFRGRRLRWGGYGVKRMLKLFRRSRGRLDPAEQDTRVYVDGEVGELHGTLEEWNRKEDEILFYLSKHLRYAEAFAREEIERRRGLEFRGTPRFFGTPDERVLWQKRLWYRMPLFIRPFLYFFHRYFLRLGVLDGWNGFVFHFLQAFWFRLVVDLRIGELRDGGRVDHD
jgi:glycosyltransferase involved in cell wall biosynthesis